MPKVCVVGGGRWGQNHIRTLSELGYLGGICDVNEDSLQRYQEQHPEVKTFTDLDLALAADMDGFTVATPAHTHFTIAKKIMQSGYPVLVEKPLALSSDEARDLQRISQETGQQLMVGHLMLFHPAIERIKELLDDGLIGKVQYIYSNRINLGTVRTEENILWSFAPHDVSIFQYLLGARPIEVVSRGGAFLQPGVHDSTMTVLRYPGNVMCHNYVSWLHPFKEHRLVLIGSKGMLRFDDSSEEKALLFYEKGIDWIQGEPIKREGVTETIAYGDHQPLTAELDYFVKNMNGKIAKADGQNAIEVLEVLELASSQIDEVSSQQQQSTNVAASAVLGRGVKVHESAYVDDGCTIGDNTKIWHYSHVQKGASIGANCSLGQSVNVGNGVRIGNDVRIQNNVSVFEGVELEDYVFCGPSMTFTNVLNPRAKYPVGAEKYGKTLVKEGVSIGAHATIVCGNTVGRYAFIAAGAVVTKDVPDYAFMLGVPARQQGWVTEAGQRIPLDHRGIYVCPVGGETYKVGEDGPSRMEDPVVSEQL